MLNNSTKGKIVFTDNNGSFKIGKPEDTSYLYFPIASEAGLKSSLTPNLGGDSMVDQETFILEPTSVENRVTIGECCLHVVFQHFYWRAK